MIYWLHRIGSPLARWLPLSVSYRLAALFAPLVFLVWSEKRRNAVRNMAQVLGAPPDAPSARRLAQQSFVNYGKYLIDMMRLASMTPDELNRRIEVRGWEHFAQAQADEAGVILVGGHIGNSDVAAAYLAGRGYPVHIIAETLEPPRWDEIVQEARKKMGVQVIPMDSNAIRSLRVLKRKGILALIIDRPMDEGGVQVRFFGQTTAVPGGAAALALRSGARLICAHILRTGSSFAIEVTPALDHPSTGDPYHDQQALTQSIFDWMERVIRDHPEQWFMFRPMWRSAAGS